jgi:hypothetical protein
MRNTAGLGIIGFLSMLVASCISLPLISIKSNFKGHIYEQKFNNMPMIDRLKSKGSPFETTLYIYEPTTINQIEEAVNPGPIITKIHSKLIDSVITDKEGGYSLYLKPGKYSVFVKYGNGYYVPYYAGKDWVSIIETKQNEITTLDILLKVNTSYE